MFNNFDFIYKPIQANAQPTENEKWTVNNL